MSWGNGTPNTSHLHVNYSEMVNWLTELSSVIEKHLPFIVWLKMNPTLIRCQTLDVASFTDLETEEKQKMTKPTENTDPVSRTSGCSWWWPRRWDNRSTEQLSVWQIKTCSTSHTGNRLRALITGCALLTTLPHQITSDLQSNSFLSSSERQR